MPNCMVCGKHVLSGYVVHEKCLKSIAGKDDVREYTCHICQNRTHDANANYCKICGSKIKKSL